MHKDLKLEEIDFNNLYKEQKEKTTFKMKSVEDWNKKAIHMNERIHKSIYNDQFLKAINYEDCKNVLDVGCGVGNLSLKIAANVKEVFSMDYSPSMLAHLKQNAHEQNITNINVIEKSWYDSWDDIPNTDIVIASRSMEVKDMKEALVKLNHKANKRVYLTYKVGGSFLDEDILNAIKKDVIKKPDYIYVLNILYSMGITASVNFLKSEGRSSMYSDVDNFVQSVVWSLGELSSDEETRLKEYFENVSQEEKDRNKYVYWALISWEK